MWVVLTLYLYLQIVGNCNKHKLSAVQVLLFVFVFFVLDELKLSSWVGVARLP